MCSKLKISTAWHSSGVFIVNFDHSQHINIEFLLLTLFVSMIRKTSNNFWKNIKRYICIVIKVARPIYHSPNWNKLWTYDISSKFALGIPSVLSFCSFIWSTISSLFHRDLIFFCCIKPFKSLKQWNKLAGI